MRSWRGEKILRVYIDYLIGFLIGSAIVMAMDPTKGERETPPNQLVTSDYFGDFDMLWHSTTIFTQIFEKGGKSKCVSIQQIYIGHWTVDKEKLIISETYYSLPDYTNEGPLITFTLEAKKVIRKDGKVLRIEFEGKYIDTDIKVKIERKP